MITEREFKYKTKEETIKVLVNDEDYEIIKNDYGVDIANDKSFYVYLPISYIKRKELRKKIYKIKNL